MIDLWSVNLETDEILSKIVYKLGRGVNRVRSFQGLRNYGAM